MTRYTVHDPVTKMKASEHADLGAALDAAYACLPLDIPGIYNPKGKYVIVQEWDGNSEPLRQWLISGKVP